MKGKPIEARDRLLARVKEDPKDARALFELARTQMYLVRMDEALEAMEKAAALRPDDARMQYWLGLVASYAGIQATHGGGGRGVAGKRFARAIAALRRALELDPANDRARRLLIGSLARLPEQFGGDPAQAEAVRKAAEKLGPVSRAWADAEILGADRKEERVKIWDRLIAEHGKSADAFEGLAQAHLLAREADRMKEAIDECLALDASRRVLLLELAVLRATDEDREGAAADLEAYLGTKPNLPMRACATLMLAKVRSTQGRRDDAQELAEKAKALDERPWFAMRPPPPELFTRP
jgi:tetratricopeptide (TPR) repeat protein